MANGVQSWKLLNRNEIKSHFSTPVALTRSGFEIEQYDMKSDTCVGSADKSPMFSLCLI